MISLLALMSFLVVVVAGVVLSLFSITPEGVAMMPGDAVLYQGVHHHHGRTTPNPNRWTAHVFLHWVSRGGAYAGEAFDKQVPPQRVEMD